MRLPSLYDVLRLNCVVDLALMSTIIFCMFSLFGPPMAFISLDGTAYVFLISEPDQYQNGSILDTLISPEHCAGYVLYRFTDEPLNLSHKFDPY